MKTVLPLLAEYLGTFLLVFVFLTTTNPLIVGGTVAVIMFVFSFGNLSTALINPAISYSMYLQSRLSLTELIYYVGVQMIAALTSYTVFRIVA